MGFENRVILCSLYIHFFQPRMASLMGTNGYANYNQMVFFKGREIQSAFMLYFGKMTIFLSTEIETKIFQSLL